MNIGAKVSVTPLAALKVKEFVSLGGIDSSLAVRIDVIGGAISGLAYDIYFDKEEANDCIFVSEDLRVLVRRDCLELLSGSTIDWIEGDNGAGFRVHNPNVPND